MDVETPPPSVVQKAGSMRMPLFVLVMVMVLFDLYAWFAPLEFLGATAEAYAAHILIINMLLLAVIWLHLNTYKKAGMLAAHLTTSLRANQAKLDRLVNMSRQGIVSFDSNDRIDFANPYFASLLAIPAENLVGSAFIEHVETSRQESVRDHLRKRRLGLSESYETVLLRGDGRQLDVHVSAAALLGENGEFLGSISVVSDISKQKQRESRIRHLAEHDPLTDLPNRLLFMEHLQQAVRQAKRFDRSLALVFIDLDHFKDVNDKYGHHIGDLALIEAAQRMRHVIRDIDVLCRHGGDEFILLFSEIASADNVGYLLDKLRNAFGKPFSIEGHQFRLTVSMGVAIYPDHAQETEELIRLADRTMYAAKANGRDTYLVYSPESVLFE